MPVMERYKQTREGSTIFIVAESDVERGYAKMACDECRGTGVYELPDRVQPCNACKGCGGLWVIVN